MKMLKPLRVHTDTHTHTRRYRFRPNRWLSLLVFVFMFTAAIAQESDYEQSCGNPEPTAEQIAAYSQSLEEFYAKGKPENGNEKSDNYDVPIHLYVINQDDGTPPYQFSTEEIVENFLNQLKYLNLNFHPNIQFYISAFDEINDTFLFYKQNPKAIVEHLEGENPDVLDDNAIQVFLNNETFGRASFPYGIKFKAGYLSSGIILHEFGHYFGLLHTFFATVYTPLDGNQCIMLFPNSEFNAECTPPNGFPECAPPLEYGDCFGDFISDTPVDVWRYDQFRNNVELQYCDENCSVDINGDNITEGYHPDYYNVMSYWKATFIRFSTEQQQRIIDVLENPELGAPPFGGDMSFLIDDDIPIVEPFNFQNSLVYPIGRVKVVKYGGGDFNFSPFKRGVVTCVNDQGGITTNIKSGYFRILENFRMIPSSVYFRVLFLPELHDNFCNNNPFYEYDYRVNMADVRRIVKHILGDEELAKPYNWIAADVNNSGTISVLDIIAIQRLLLGVTESLDVPSWRYVPKYALNDESFNTAFNANPFTAVWHQGDIVHAYLDNPDNMEVDFSYLGEKNNTEQFKLEWDNPDLQEFDTWNFYAVKSGDVTNVGELEEVVDGNGGDQVPGDIGNFEGLAIDVSSDAEMVKGENYEILVKAQDAMDLEAFQLSFDLTDLAVKDIRGQGDFIIDDNNYHIDGSKLSVVWTATSIDAVTVMPDDVLFVIEVSPKAGIVKEEVKNTINLSGTKFASKLFETKNTDGADKIAEAKSVTLQLKVEDASGSVKKHEIQDLYPLPVVNSLSGTLKLGEDANVSIHLFDIFGTSEDIDLGACSQGVVPFTIPDNIMDNFVSGFIYYHIQIGDETFSGSLIKL